MITNGKRPVTIKDIALVCGIHNSTVSRALRGDPRVTEETRRFVTATATEMGYHPALNESARRMRMRNLGQSIINHAVGLFFPFNFSATPFFAEMFRGVLEGFSARGFGLFVQEMPDKFVDASSLPPIFYRGELDGLIGVANPRLGEILPILRNNPGFDERPVVTLVKGMPGCAAVRADEQAGTYAVVHHLLQLGHRHLLLCLFSPENDDREGRRLAGIRAALTDAGLDPAESLHPFVPTNINPWLDPITARSDRQAFDLGSGAMAEDNRRLLEMLRAHPEITAILALNDVMAVHIWYLLQQAGFRIPEDYSLAGFDDTDAMLDEHGRNLLTTVRMPLLEMGHQAAEVMAGQINGTDVINRLLPTQFIERASTAPPRR